MGWLFLRKKKKKRAEFPRARPPPNFFLSREEEKKARWFFFHLSTKNAHSFFTRAPRLLPKNYFFDFYVWGYLRFPLNNFKYF
jgi:hypothetical protein